MPQARQARGSGENLNYVTLVPQARQARLSGEILNHFLSRCFDILSMIIGHFTCFENSQFSLILITVVTFLLPPPNFSLYQLLPEH